MQIQDQMQARGAGHIVKVKDCGVGEGGVGDVQVNGVPYQKRRWESGVTKRCYADGR